MILNLNERRRSSYTNTSGKYRFFDLVQKPIEIYFFLDPLCPKCWSLEPYLKKLSIEYGRYFTIRPIISNHLSIVESEETNHPIHQMNHDQIYHEYHPLNQQSAALPSITMAIKAAELQGKNAGRIFLRKIQENFFLKRKDVSDISILLRCAIDSKLDIEEFINDLNSSSAKKASQCDIKITKEMHVDQAPSVVFFNHLAEEDGVKISGINTYDIYVFILSDMLKRNPSPSKKPPIEDYLAYYKVVSQKEISIVYDLTIEQVEHEMIKLQLIQKAERKETTNEIFWKYVHQSKPSL